MTVNFERMQNNRKRVYLLAFLLLLPATFYFGPITDVSNLQSIIKSIWTYPEFYMTTLSYLLLFYVLLSTKDTFWKPFFVIGSWLLLLSSVIYTLDDIHITQNNHILTVLKYVFVENKGMWPVESFMTISLLLLTTAALKNISRLKRELRVLFTEQSNAIGKIGTYSLALIGLGIFGTMAYENFRAISNRHNILKTYTDSTGSLYKGGMYTVTVYGVIHLLLNLVLITLAILFSLRVIEQCANEFKAFLKTLSDFRLNSYLTRTIAGYIYTSIYFIVITASSLFIPLAAFNLFSIAVHSSINVAHPVLWLIFLAVPALGALATFLILLIVRLSFETTVALVHIAENTYRSSLSRF